MTDRRAELSASLTALHHRIDTGLAAAGRIGDRVLLVAVTKTFPASDVRLLAELGVTDVGENRDQEAAPKHGELADLGLVWHFVGRLQRNKCRSVASYADVVQSLDRPELAVALGRAAVASGRTLTAFLQVSLDAGPAPGRGGVAPRDMGRLADQVASTDGLNLGGVMGVAPLGGDPARAFARLHEAATLLRADHPAATAMSAGMSGDLESALRHGATHLRVGTALLGRRPVPVG